MNPNRLLNSAPVIFGVAALIVALIGLGITAPNRQRGETKEQAQARRKAAADAKKEEKAAKKAAKQVCTIDFKDPNWASSRPIPPPAQKQNTDTKPNVPLQYTKIALKFHVEGCIDVPTIKTLPFAPPLINVKPEFEDFMLTSDPSEGLISLGHSEDLMTTTTEVMVPYQLGPPEFISHISDVLATIQAALKAAKFLPGKFNLPDPKDLDLKNYKLTDTIAFNTTKTIDIKKVNARLDKIQDPKQKEAAKKAFEDGRKQMGDILGGFGSANMDTVQQVITKFPNLAALIAEMTYPTPDDSEPEEEAGKPLTPEQLAAKKKILEDNLLKKVSLGVDANPFNPTDKSVNLRAEICVTLKKLGMKDFSELNKAMEQLKGSGSKSKDKTKKDPLAILTSMDKYIEKIEVVFAAPATPADSGGGDAADNP